jgi:hypothetical protein
MELGIENFDISDTATRLQRLSLSVPKSAQPHANPLSFNRLMDGSTERLTTMAHSTEQDEWWIASRILESTKSYELWEREHAEVMRRVAQQGRVKQQCNELLTGTFTFIHRKSLFAYLRQHHLGRHRREQLLSHFFSNQNQARGLIVEHGVFLRSSASLACASYLGTELLQDAVFCEPIKVYEQMYGIYFDCYCEWALMPPESADVEFIGSTVYALKCDLGALRQAITGLANKLSVQEEGYLFDNPIS